MAVLVALVLIVILTFSFFGPLAPLVSRLFSPNSVELENQQADDLKTDDLETDDQETGRSELDDLLSRFFTEEMLSTMPRVDNVISVSDGFVLQVVAAARTDDKAMIILTVMDYEQRGLFVDRILYETSRFQFRVTCDNSKPLHEGFLDYSDPNTGVVVLYLIDLTSDETINLTLDQLSIGYWLDHRFVDEGLSDGTWSFSFETEHQPERTISCNLDAIGSSFYDLNYRYPTKVTKVSVAPFCVTIIAGGVLLFDNDINLIMDNGDRVVLCISVDDGSLMQEHGPRACKLVSMRGYTRDIGGGRYEKFFLISSDSGSQLKGALLEVDRIIAIEINGVRQDF